MSWIDCEFCHDPAWFVYQNHDPGVLTPPPALPDQEPLELYSETAVCGHCNRLADKGLLMELVERAVKKWTRDLGGIPSMPGDEQGDPGSQAEFWTRTVTAAAARVQAWHMSRRSYYELYDDGDEPGPNDPPRPWPRVIHELPGFHTSRDW